MSSLVRLQQLSNVRNKRVFGVRVGQEGADGKQDLADGQCWTPLILQNVQTDTTVGVDVTVVDTCREMDLGRLCKEKGESDKGPSISSIEVPAC